MIYLVLVGEQLSHKPKAVTLLDSSEIPETELLLQILSEDPNKHIY